VEIYSQDKQLKHSCLVSLTLCIQLVPDPIWVFCFLSYTKIEWWFK